MPEHNHVPPRDNPDVAHEHSDVNVRLILIFGAALLVAALVIHLALYWLLERYNESSPRPSRAASAPGTQESLPPEPRLQVAPRADMANMRAAEERELQTYGWVDREKQVVRIPIDRAMQLIAERGLPARKEAGQTSEKKTGESTDPKQTSQRRSEK
jgi:hypothetical protein